MPVPAGRDGTGLVPQKLGAGPSSAGRSAVGEGWPIGYAEAYAAAFAEAKAAAKVDQMRWELLRYGERKFGTPAARVLIELAAVGDAKAFLLLADRLMSVQTWEDMFPRAGE